MSRISDLMKNMLAEKLPVLSIQVIDETSTNTRSNLNGKIYLFLRKYLIFFYVEDLWYQYLGDIWYILTRYLEKSIFRHTLLAVKAQITAMEAANMINQMNIDKLRLPKTPEELQLLHFPNGNSYLIYIIK